MPAVAEAPTPQCSLQYCTKVSEIYNGKVAANPDGEWAVAYLTGIGQMSDEHGRVLRVLRRVVTRWPQTEQQRRIIASAQETLLILEARMEQENSHSSLLRAADPDSASAASLLRPAAEASVDQDDLLKPVCEPLRDSEAM